MMMNQISSTDFEDNQPEDAVNAEADPTVKAVKADDAKVPIQLWNDRVVENLEEH